MRPDLLNVIEKGMNECSQRDLRRNVQMLTFFCFPLPIARERLCERDIVHNNNL